MCFNPLPTIIEISVFVINLNLIRKYCVGGALRSIYLFSTLYLSYFIRLNILTYFVERRVFNKPIDVKCMLHYQQEEGKVNVCKYSSRQATPTFCLVCIMPKFEATMSFNSLSHTEDLLRKPLIPKTCFVSYRKAVRRVFESVVVSGNAHT